MLTNIFSVHNLLHTYVRLHASHSSQSHMMTNIFSKQFCFVPTANHIHMMNDTFSNNRIRFILPTRMPASRGSQPHTYDDRHVFTSRIRFIFSIRMPASHHSQSHTYDSTPSF